MNLFDKIDAAIFKVVDGFVLWCWDELGVKYAELTLGAWGVAQVLFIAQQSKWGRHYDLDFWLMAGVCGVSMLFIAMRVLSLPAVALSASNVAWRVGILARVLRFFWLLAGLGLLGNRGDTFAAVAQLTALLIGDAAVPTKPRNKKRREVLVPAYSRT